MDPHPTPRRARHRAARALVAVATIGSVLVIGAQPAAAGPTPVMRGYVPLPADEFQLAQESINPASTTTIDFTVGITNAGDGAVIYYDEWEDGFEADPANPVQSTTKVWGDGDDSNGDAASACSTPCTGDLLTAGDVFVLRNTFTTPRSASEIVFDGRDRVSSTRGFALTAGGFSSVGSVFSGSASAYDTSKYGTNYVVPVGENSDTPVGASPAFEYTGIVAMASADDTTVRIDTDADGTVDITETIDEGEVTFVNGGVDQGATVTSDRPIQVQIVTGDVGATYESRWFTLFPTPLLSSDYLNAVGSGNDNQRTITYLFNPTDDSVDVIATCTSCSTTLTIPAQSGASFASPLNEAVRFASSGGEAFAAVGAIGSQSGAAPGSGADNSSSYDWGFTLVPTGLLTTQAVLGWAPGNSANPPSSTPAGNYNDGPVWITTLDATTVRVDFDGDPATGALGADCVGSHDLEISVAALASTRIFDSIDGDMTGARIYTCDGTDISGAWGEDPQNAPIGSPGFDAGYALIPTTAMVVDKTASQANDTNGDGRIGPGDEGEYTVAISDAGSLAFTNVSISDDLGDGLAYVPDSTTIDVGSGPSAFPDDVTPPAGTPFPFDESGAPIPDIDAGDTVTVRYRALIDAATLPAGVTSVANSVVVVADEADATDLLVTELATSDLSLTKTLVATPQYVGELAVYDVTVTNDGPDPAVGVTVADAVPAGTTLVTADPSVGTYSEASGEWNIPSIGVGSSVTFQLSVTVDATAVVNTAEVVDSGSIDPDSQPAENALGSGGDSPDQDDEGIVELDVDESADLSLTKTRTAGPSSNGTTTFRVELSNDGPNDATGVVVNEYPPAGAKYWSSTATAGSFILAGDLWMVGTVAAGTTEILDVTYVIDAAPSVNFAEVGAVDQHDPDSAPAEGTLGDANPPDQDDEAQASVPGLADLSLAKSVVTAPSNTGDTVTWDIDITNDGPHAAAAVVVRDELPAGLAFVSATATSGSYDDATGDWSVGTVSSEATETLTLTAMVTAAGSITNTAQVWATDTDDPDSTPANSSAGEDDQASATFSTTGASLGDLVFHDVDGDGTHDLGEPVLAGVDLTVRWAGPDLALDTGDDVVTSVTTDASGEWSLEDLPSGDYRISVDPASLPVGLRTPTADRDGAGTAHVAALTLAGGATVDDADFGYRGAGIVGDTVFDDADGDDLPDAGEGVPGVDVTVTWNGTVTQTVTTNSSGNWAVFGLPDGDIDIEIDADSVPTGLVHSVDPDASGVGNADGRSSITLSGGESRLDQDFGFVGGGVIGDAVWSDTDGDGALDAAEPGLGGVLVTLSRDVDADGDYETLVRTELSAGSGAYSFEGLAPGRYRVEVTTPSGQTPSTSTLRDVILGADETIDDVDFGFEPPAPAELGSIGDLVWNDADADGVRDAGEPGLGGVTVTLRGDSDGDGTFDAEIATVDTDADGAYLFEHLPAGGYQVVVAAGAERFATTPAVVPMALGAGQDLDTVDVGLSSTAPDTGSIGDLVWDDLNADGNADLGEPGLDNVTVTLRSDPDGDGVYDVVAATQVTVAGAYEFTDVAMGIYRVVIEVPDGAVASTPSMMTVGVGAGQSVDTADFGVTSSAIVNGSIGDRVWSDTDRDGIADAGEPGINGVVMTLRSDLDGDGSFETEVSQVTTAGDGEYSFANLAPGDYLVVITPPEAMAPTTVPQRGVALSAGESVTDADFGLATAPTAPFDLRLAVAASGNPDTGGEMIWTVDVANAGLGAAPGPITVTAVLPDGVEYLDVDGDGWTCTAAGQAVTCTRSAALAVGGTEQLELLTRVNAVPGTQLAVTATVAAAGVEVTLANNADSAEVIAQAPPTTTTTTTTTTTPTTVPAPGTSVPGPVRTVAADQLAVTGRSIADSLWVGVAAVVVGAGLVALRRRARA